MKIVSGVMLTLLFIAILSSSFNIRPVRGEWVGIVHIRADGSIDPQTAPIKQDGDVYIFTNNIFGEISVERNNIVIDGNGFMVEGYWSPEVMLFRPIYGFTLLAVRNVTICNTCIKKFSTAILVKNSSEIIIRENNITENFCGIEVESSFDNDILKNKVYKNWHGITLTDSSINRIFENLVSENNIVGIYPYNSSNTVISQNDITENGNGIYLYKSSGASIDENSILRNKCGIYFELSCYNTIRANEVTNNSHGIFFIESSNNRFYHNDFIYNTKQVYDFSWDDPYYNPSINIWDYGYGYGFDDFLYGNYWSDYIGVDEKRGPNQDQPGPDFVGDMPYIIDDNNIDHYPLMCRVVGEYVTFNGVALEYFLYDYGIAGWLVKVEVVFQGPIYLEGKIVYVYFAVPLPAPRGFIDLNIKPGDYVDVSGQYEKNSNAVRLFGSGYYYMVKEMVKIVSFESIPAPLFAGQNFTYSVIVKNICDQPVRIVGVTSERFDPEQYVILNYRYCVYMEPATILPGELVAVGPLAFWRAAKPGTVKVIVSVLYGYESQIVCPSLWFHSVQKFVLNILPPSKTYTLHVQSMPINEIQISYSGDYSGAGITSFDIGPKNSPFMVILTAPSTYQDYRFHHWELDGVAIGESNSLTVIVNDERTERTAVAVYLKEPLRYILHVQSHPIAGVQISYSGDFSGNEKTNFDIESKSPFVIILNAPAIHQNYKFDHWEVSGIGEEGRTITSEFTKLEIIVKREITATAYYARARIYEEFFVVDGQKMYDVRVYFREGEGRSILDLIDKPSPPFGPDWYPGVSVPLRINRWSSILEVEVSLDGKPVVNEKELNRVLQAVSGWVMAKYTVDNSVGSPSSSFEIMNDFTKDVTSEGVLVKIINKKGEVLGLPRVVACPQSLLKFGVWKDALATSIERSFLQVMAPDASTVSEWVDEIVGDMDSEVVTDDVKAVLTYLVKASLIRVEGASVLSSLKDYAKEKGVSLDPEFIEALETVVSTYGVSNYKEIIEEAIRIAVEEGLKECVKKSVEEILNKALETLTKQLAEKVSVQFATAFSSIVSGIAMGYVVADAIMKPCENFRLATSVVAGMYVAREYGKLEKVLMSDLASSRNIALSKAHTLINLRKMELCSIGQSYIAMSQMGDVSLLNKLVSIIGVWSGSMPTKKQILEAADIFLYPSKNIEQVTPLLVDNALGRSYYWIEPISLSTHLFRGEQRKLSVKITPQVTIDTQDFETLFLHENSPTVSIEKVEYSNGVANVNLLFSAPENADFGLYNALALMKTKDETRRIFTLHLSINVLPDNMLRVEILSPVPNERREVIGGKDLKISARVTLKEGSEVKPAENAEVTAHLTASKMTGSAFSSYKMNYAGEGIYETTVDLEEFCAYTIDIVAEKRGLAFIFIPIQLYIPGSASIEFVIIPKSALTITLRETQHKLYLHIYDSQNRHVGINYETNETEVQIPGALYYDFNDGTISVTLPANLTSFRYLVDAKYATQPSESFNISIVNYKDGVAISSFNESAEIKQAQQYTKNVQILSDGKIKVEDQPVQNWIWSAIIGIIAILSALTATIFMKKRVKSKRYTKQNR